MLRLPIENTLDREEKIMAEWVERKISDIGTVVGGATPSTKSWKTMRMGKLLGLRPRIYPHSPVVILNGAKETLQK